MKILIIAPRFPYPLDKGDRLTIYHMLRFLSGKGHQISFVCFTEVAQKPEVLEQIKGFCHRIEIIPFQKSAAYFNVIQGFFGPTPLQILYYKNSEMKLKIDQIIEEENPDLLYAHTIRMGPYIQHAKAFKRVLAMQISMTLNYKRLAEHSTGFISGIINRREYQKLRKFEAPLARSFDKALLISKHDLNAVEQQKPLENIFYSPHGVDYQFFSPDLNVQKEEKTLIFSGNMGYEPNVDAALYFANEIFPLILEEEPTTKWYIVGTQPAAEILELDKHPQITVTGRVPDLRTYLNKVTLSIDPLRVGAGLQNKILEGMSMGLPMVVTPVANEGIQAIHKENIFVENTPNMFAEKVISILRNPEIASTMGDEARKFIIEKWSWETHFEDLEEMFESLGKN